MQQNDSRLVIRDFPILQGVLGILFAGVGTLVLSPVTQVPFNEIVGINVDRRITGGKGGFTDRLTLLRKDGQVIPLQSVSSSGWKGKELRAVVFRRKIRPAWNRPKPWPRLNPGSSATSWRTPVFPPRRMSC